MTTEELLVYRTEALNRQINLLGQVRGLAQRAHNEGREIHPDEVFDLLGYTP